MISETDRNKVLPDKIDNCCDDYPAAFLVTYTSGRTWMVCLHCDQHEAFQLGRTSRTRIEK